MFKIPKKIVQNTVLFFSKNTKIFIIFIFIRFFATKAKHARTSPSRHVVDVCKGSTLNRKEVEGLEHDFRFEEPKETAREVVAEKEARCVNTRDHYFNILKEISLPHRFVFVKKCLFLQYYCILYQALLLCCTVPG